MTGDVLPDYLAPALRAVFCGTAVSTHSALRGGYYAGPGNEFWPYLYRSGMTTVLLSPERDNEILQHGLGLTDLLKSSAAASDRGLSGFDVPAFIAKMKRYSPAWIPFHGKGAAKVVSRFLGKGGDVWLGVQSWTVAGIPAYVLPSASGSNRGADLEGLPNRLAWFEDLAARLPSHPAARSKS